MKYNYTLYELINRYCSWAKFDWCVLVHDPVRERMFAYDFDKNKSVTINYVLKRIIDNRDLDKCFDLDELTTLMILVPKKFKKDVLTFI